VIDETSTGTTHVLGRKPKSSTDDIIPVAWDLFEKNGYDATTMSDIASATGISRRTLFNYFPTKEALLYPAVSEYMAEFTRSLIGRPDDEALFASLEYSLLQCRDKQLELENKFNPGPVVHAARLGESAIRYTRDLWASEMEKAVAVKLEAIPGGAVLAGFVGALAAQVWTEITKHMKAQGPDADIDTALTVAMSTLKRLFA
jgi:AcrR family transcriptional regulator